MALTMKLSNQRKGKDNGNLLPDVLLVVVESKFALAIPRWENLNYEVVILQKVK